MSFISAKDAATLDQELMSTDHFSLDQLMELAGLLVAIAIHKEYSHLHSPLLFIGPGNNGGDGLVIARHLKLWGYAPTIYYPKRPNKQIYINLLNQLKDLDITIIDSIDHVSDNHDLFIDCLFGFSFSPPIRLPFISTLQFLSTTSIPIVSVDIPSGWDVNNGPPNTHSLTPTMLVSLTAPKPCCDKFNGIHYLGGRFISDKIAEKYGISHWIKLYKSDDQVVKLN